MYLACNVILIGLFITFELLSLDLQYKTTIYVLLLTHVIIFFALKDVFTIHL